MKYRNVEVNFASESDQLRIYEDTSVLITPNILSISEIGFIYFQKVRLLVAKQLHHLGVNCFERSAITKVIGNKLETIDDQAFQQSFFLEQINLKNVRKIGSKAFQACNLKVIKNNFITELFEDEFEYNSGIELIKMKNLMKLNLKAFQDCPIQVFDAPNVVEIVESEYKQPIAENNFKTKNNIVTIPKYKDKKRDLEQMIKRLPEGCFRTDTVTQQNSDLFVVDNCLVFPPNIKTIQKFAYSDSKQCIFQVFGNSVTEVEDSAFPDYLHLHNVDFPSAIKIGSWCFASCEQLITFIAPKCTQFGVHAFTMCKNLKRFVAQPKILPDNLFDGVGLKFLDLPSVERALENGTFESSLIEGVNMVNCKLLRDGTLKNCYASSGCVLIGSANPRHQLFQLKQIIGLLAHQDEKIKIKVKLCLK